MYAEYTLSVDTASPDEVEIKMLADCHGARVIFYADVNSVLFRDEQNTSTLSHKFMLQLVRADEFLIFEAYLCFILVFDFADLR